ncbi:MAG: TraR/DksA family transcriptional regulator [Elusimicrobiota bacterium]
MNKRDALKIRKFLEEERKDFAEIVARIKEREEEYLNGDVGDDIDKATGDAQREILFCLSANDRLKVDAIKDAIRKIDEGRFGICESCRKKISKARLDAIPYARLCIKCKPRDESSSFE